MKAVPPRRTRLFALDLHDEAGRAAKLQGRVATALEKVEERPFWPHVTLARVRRGARASPLDLAPPWPIRAFRPSALTLYRSQPSPRGAEYSVVESLALEPA